MDNRLTQFADKDSLTETSTDKFSELSVAEEYFRKGVWKIYYKVRSKNYSYMDTNVHTGKTFTGEHPPEEIKFSGEDAKERALKYFEMMKSESEKVNA